MRDEGILDESWDKWGVMNHARTTSRTFYDRHAFYDRHTFYETFALYNFLHLSILRLIDDCLGDCGFCKK
jgi:hypothetical protein